MFRIVLEAGWGNIVRGIGVPNMVSGINYIVACPYATFKLYEGWEADSRNNLKGGVVIYLENMKRNTLQQEELDEGEYYKCILQDDISPERAKVIMKDYMQDSVKFSIAMETQFNKWIRYALDHTILAKPKGGDSYGS